MFGANGVGVFLGVDSAPNFGLLPSSKRAGVLASACYCRCYAGLAEIKGAGLPLRRNAGASMIRRSGTAFAAQCWEAASPLASPPQRSRK